MKRIQILGTGCPKCRQLTANAEAAVKELGLEATVEKVEKIAEILQFGVMITPALVIDGGYGGVEPSSVIDLSSGVPAVVRAGKGDVSAFQ